MVNRSIIITMCDVIKINDLLTLSYLPIALTE